MEPSRIEPTSDEIDASIDEIVDSMPDGGLDDWLRAAWRAGYDKGKQ